MLQSVTIALYYTHQVFQSNCESDDKDSPDLATKVDDTTGSKVKFTCSDSEL